MTTNLPDVPEDIIERLIEEGTVDCYDQHEAEMGMLISVMEGVETPFSAQVMGEAVDVLRLEESEKDGSIQAVCKKQNDSKRYSIALSSLEWVEPLPEGYEWIAAYFHWRNH